MSLTSAEFEAPIVYAMQLIEDRIHRASAAIVAGLFVGTAFACGPSFDEQAVTAEKATRIEVAESPRWGVCESSSYNFEGFVFYRCEQGVWEDDCNLGESLVVPDERRQDFFWEEPTTCRELGYHYEDLDDEEWVVAQNNRNMPGACGGFSDASAACTGGEVLEPVFGNVSLPVVAANITECESFDFELRTYMTLDGVGTTVFNGTFTASGSLEIPPTCSSIEPGPFAVEATLEINSDDARFVCMIPKSTSSCAASLEGSCKRLPHDHLSAACPVFY